MDLLKLLNDFPESWLLATIFGVIGFFSKILVDFLLNKTKKRVELQELYWKEKIQSAKKASEYYLFQVGFFTLTADKYEMIEENREGADELIKSTEELIDSYRNRLIEFPHFEHFHINLFYDFKDTTAEETVKENYKCIQKIHSIKFLETDNKFQYDEKFKIVIENFRILKTNNRKLVDIYQGFLTMIREDIKTLQYK